LILLQLPPIVVGSSCTGDDENGDGEFATRVLDFIRALANVNDLVSRRLVSRCAKACRLRVSPH
jgi:hypothetical protein